MVGIQEAVEAGENLVDRLRAPRGVGIHQQGARQQVRVDPGIPVIHRRRVVQAHPTEVLPVAIDAEQAAVDFPFQPLADQRMHLVDLFAEQVVGPGEERAGFGREEFDDRLLHIGQSHAALLCAHVGGDTPETLLADGPDAVGDVVEEAPFAFHALRQYGCSQVGAASELHGFPMGAVAVACVLEKERGGERLIRFAEERFAFLDDGVPVFRRKCAPCIAIGGGGIGIPVSAIREALLQRSRQCSGCSGDAAEE